MIDNLFFDLDGTLLDTERDIRSCFHDALLELNIASDGFDDRFVIGPPLRDAVKLALPKLNDDQINSLIDLFRYKYDISEYPETTAYPGIESMIRILKKKECRLYIATNKRRIPARRLLSRFQWDSSFEDVFAVDMIEGMQTDKSDMLSIGMERFGVRRNSAVMIGDTPNDIAAGKKIGMHTIGVSWGYTSRREMLDATPSGLADAPHMIVDLIRFFS